MCLLNYGIHKLGICAQEIYAKHYIFGYVFTLYIRYLTQCLFFLCPLIISCRYFRFIILFCFIFDFSHVFCNLH